MCVSCSLINRFFLLQRGVLGDKVTFGEDLDRVAKINIPIVLQKTTTFINSHGEYINPRECFLHTNTFPCSLANGRTL